MKANLNPAVVAAIIVVVILIAGFMYWKGGSGSTDGATKPVDTSKFMKK